MDWKRFFDSLGLDGTRWQWRIFRLQQRWDDFRASAGTTTGNVGYTHRLCRNCGGLLDRDTKICPRCGERLESFRKVQLRRVLGILLPEGLSVAYVLIAVNVLTMAVIMFLPLGASLQEAGALRPSAFFAGEFWRILSYAYLHGGLLHIFFNMASLKQVGMECEREIGGTRFFVLYTLCALAGGAADLVATALGMPRAVVGASGAIFGLIGFGLSYHHFYGGTFSQYASRVYLRWAIYGFAFSFVPGIDWVCHLGGFLVGMILGFLIERDLRAGDRFRILWRTLAAILGIATVVAIIAMILRSTHYFVT